MPTASAPTPAAISPASPPEARNTTRQPVFAAGRLPCRRLWSLQARCASPTRTALLALRSVLGTRPDALPSLRLHNNGWRLFAMLVAGGLDISCLLSLAGPTI